MRLQFHRGCWIWWLLLTFGHAQDSVIVFNEIHVQPSSEGSEWIELHNQMAVDVDISGWRLRGGVHYDFPASTVIGGGDYLVIAADPSNPPDIDHVLGPFSGRLDNAGDTLRLEDRSTLGTVPGGLARHRLMDEITYLQGDTEEGITWAKIDPDGGTIPRNNWATSHETGGTPGTTNFPQDAPARTATFSVPGAVVINEIMYRQRPFHAKPAVPGEYENDPLIGLQSSWQFDASGSVPPIDWQSSASLDWPSRSAPFGIGLDSPPVTVQTPLPLSSETSSYVNAHYFRQTFEFAGDPSEIHDLSLHSYVDDGAVIYVNGTEIHRVNLPEGPITERTSALDDEGAPDLLTISGIDPSLLRVGVNQLAVALHQKFTLFVKSDDAIFAAEMFARRATKAPIPAEPHRESDEEWIELHNRSTQEVDLSGWRLQDEIDHLFPEGTFIAPGGYLVVDSFQGTLSNSGARLALHDSQDQIVDEVHYRDNGRWPKTADGYGASLELRNPHADNRIAEAWAASNEQPHATWQTYSYEGVAEDDGIGTRLYHELVIGMLDAGEILLDDVSVIQDPHGAAIELMQNGDFEQGAIQEVPNHWLA
ncbi:MAG: lamin tail domain-containing protein, partial [Verrucomicrobiales bacterium]